MSSPTYASRLPVRTHHCRFCNHLLLATTRDLHDLPRRKDPARDAALILPLPEEEEEEEEEENENENESEDENENNQPTTPQARPRRTKQNQHSTLLLSTALPDRKATLVRREDGIEKRLLVRCGRCRVVMGYFLDSVHFGQKEGPRVVYLLPGSLTETQDLGKEKGSDREWTKWAE